MQARCLVVTLTGVGAMASIADICAGVFKNRDRRDGAPLDDPRQRRVAVNTQPALFAAAAAFGVCVVAAVLVARGKRQ